MTRITRKLLNFKKNSPSSKVLVTVFIIFLFKFGASIPLYNLDNEALQKSFLQLESSNNSLVQMINMYSGGGGKTLVSPFSLGIIPYINASILIDLLSALFPRLEKLQLDESGRRDLAFYKKMVAVLLAIIQSYFLITALKAYFYDTNLLNLTSILIQFVSGSLIMIWLTNLIDTKGLGNGTSLIIFTNIITSLYNKNLFSLLTGKDSLVLIVLIGLICVSQMAKVVIPIVSARQLAFLENSQKQNQPNELALGNSTLLIRFTQAGIFPIIIASNLLPFFSNFIGVGQFSKLVINGIYYFLIIIFNYFYTSVFWDPEKISEQLRKSSVSLINITPGRQTATYLENVVRSSSLMGGVFLCIILYSYDLIKQLLNSPFLNQLNISSLIILVGVIYELQKTIKALYKTVF
jgi:preprotein translocase subunit SecY